MITKSIVIAMLAAALALPCAHAADPADGNIKSAVIDLQRYEQQFAGKTQARATNVKRTLKLLSIARGNLDSSANQSHPSWIDADARYHALVSHLKSLLNPAGGTANTASAATANQPSAASAPKPANSAGNSGAKPMISQQRVRINKLTRDIKSAADSLNQGGVKPFQSQAYVKKFTDAADRYQQTLNKYNEFATDPDVQNAANELQVLQNMIAFGNAEAAKVLAEIGNVQQQLATVYQRRQSSPRLELPAPPYSSDAISDWIKTAAGVRRNAIADYKSLQVIHEKAYLPLSRGTVEQGAAFDSQNVDSMLRSSQGDVTKVDQQLQTLTDGLNTQHRHIESGVEWIEKLDPLNDKDQGNSFLAAGADTEIHERLAGLASQAEAAITFDRTLKRDSLASRQALLQRIASARGDYDRKREISLNAMRMPVAVSSDATLLQQARDTLAKPDYEVGEILRLVINSDIRHLETESSEVEYDKVDISSSGDIKLSGTKTTTFYAWDQYQVATAEPVGDKHFVFYNTLKFFTKGGTTTPLNRWILSGRIQGSEIAQGNIDK